jgi:hypothetical protein
MSTAAAHKIDLKFLSKKYQQSKQAKPAALFGEVRK